MAVTVGFGNWCLTLHCYSHPLGTGFGREAAFILAAASHALPPLQKNHPPSHAHTWWVGDRLVGGEKKLSISSMVGRVTCMASVYQLSSSHLSYQQQPYLSYMAAAYVCHVLYVYAPPPPLHHVCGDILVLFHLLQTYCVLMMMGIFCSWKLLFSTYKLG